MELQADWWKSPLASEIHSTLRSRETRIPVYYARSPQISLRRGLVDWLAVICDQYKLCPTGRHLAVLLLDFFMDTFEVQDAHMQMVALACLLIAEKFEEQEIQIPKAADLSRYLAPTGHEAVSFLQMELLILDTFNWNIGFPTAAHFSDFFLTVAVTDGDFHGDQPLAQAEQARKYMAKYVNYFLEVSLQDHLYRDYLPSLVCAACLGSARMCLQIAPVWSINLEKITQYSWTAVRNIVQNMMKTYQVDEQATRGHLYSKSVVDCSPASNPSTGSPVYPSTPCTPHTPYQPPVGVPGVGDLILQTPVNHLPLLPQTMPSFVLPCQYGHVPTTIMPQTLRYHLS